MLVLLVVLAVAVLWTVASIRIVRTDEVGLKRYFGNIKEEIYPTGPVFVPLFPWIDLVRVPRRLLKLSYEGKDKDKVYTKDFQLVFPEATFFLRFPYKEIDSMIKMVQSGVPLTEEALKPWAEDILLPCLRQVFSEKDHTELIGDVDLNSISSEVSNALHQSNNMMDCGVMGREPDDTTPGTGQAFAEIEVVALTPELQKKHQDIATTKLEAQAAKATAQMNAEQVGGQILGIVARQHAMTVSGLERDLRDHPEKRGKSVKDGGYAETFDWAQAQTTRDRASNVNISQDRAEIDISSGGKAIENPDFKAAAVIAGAIGAAVRLGKSGDRGKGRGKGKGLTEQDKANIRRDING